MPIALPPRTWHVSLALGSVCAVVGLCAVLYAFDPLETDFYPPCLFRKLTGLLCPGCGSGRALHRLLHGELLAAFRLNPLLVLVAPVLLASGISALWELFTGRALTTARLHHGWIWALLAGILLFWIGRNLG